MADRPLDELKDLEICGCLGFVEFFLETASRKPDAPPAAGEGAHPDQASPASPRDSSGESRDSREGPEHR